MLIAIVLLWMAIQMQAPLWIYAIIISLMAVKIINAILGYILKRLEKKKNEEEKRGRRLRAIADGSFDEFVKIKGEQDGE